MRGSSNQAGRERRSLRPGGEVGENTGEEGGRWGGVLDQVPSLSSPLSVCLERREVELQKSLLCRSEERRVGKECRN